jgi:hypothetical protein
VEKIKLCLAVSFEIAADILLDLSFVELYIHPSLSVMYL